jgi:hypothetical protein
MGALWLVYTLNYLPVRPGPHAAMYSTTRDAAFIQSGAKAEWNKNVDGAKKVAPKDLVLGITAIVFVYHVDKQREVILHSRYLGNWSVTKTGASVSYGFSW